MQTESDPDEHWIVDETPLPPSLAARLAALEVRLALLEDVAQGLRHILLGLLHRRSGTGEERQP